ncbi:MAG: helix-turn-helix domain-containing protein [Planctomycetota bacterium]|nr:helix-turn-helix domain-containing protein [Planctomycetota bacterium]
MAKMFYTIDEAAERLGKSADEVQQMANSGQLQEFRDGDRLMFKKEQVDLLGGGADEDVLKLGEDLEPLSLSSSGSGSALGLGLDQPSDSTGISIFDPDETETADPSAQTQVTDSGLDAGFDLDSASSGSGLLDLTKEADDTSLGADLLDDVYGQETMGATSPAGESGIVDGASALFEGSEGEADAAAAAPAAAMVPMLAEAYDGAWSGIGGGLALGMALCLAFGIAVVIFAMTGTIEPVKSIIGGQFYAVAGGMAGVVVIFAIVGMVLGKKS